MAPRSRSAVSGLQVWLPETSLLIALPCLVAALAWLGVRISDGRKVAALISGYDISVGVNDAPEVMFARAKFYLDRDEFEQAQPLVQRVAQSAPMQTAANILYDTGNSRLRHAIHLIEDGKFDAATADVVLARDFYMRALRLEPGFWDAKYNLDVAMRLVRDFPDVQIQGDDRKRPTSRLWTDLPGLPKGGP